MTLKIELTTEEAERLRAAAQRDGLDEAECARRLLVERLPAEPSGEATRRLLATWREEDATEDPEAVRQAEEELAEFKQAMNVTRDAAGARRLYP